VASVNLLTIHSAALMVSPSYSQPMARLRQT
jgi:hypothetical protein